MTARGGRSGGEFGPDGGRACENAAGEITGGESHPKSDPDSSRRGVCVETGCVTIRTAILGPDVIASAVGLAVLMRFGLAEVGPRYVGSIERTMQDSTHLIAATLSEDRVDDMDSPFNAWAKSGLRLRVKSLAGEVIFDSRPGDLLAVEREVESRRYKSTKNRISWMIDRAPLGR